MYKALIALVVALLLGSLLPGFIDRLSQEAAASNLPTSRHQVEQRVDRAVFGDFDALMSSIG